MKQQNLKQILAGVSLAALLAGAAATGCAHGEKSATDRGKGGAGEQKTQDGGSSGCGGKSGCGGASGCGGKKP